MNEKKRIPIVDLGLVEEEYYITDYIQVDNPRLRRIAASVKAKTVKGVIKQVLKFVAKSIEYPLDYKGRPTAARHVKVFKWWNGFYLADISSGYGWLFPNQTVSVRKGVCIDTACLCTSLLRIKGVEAYTILGAVLRTRDKRFLGFHAWTEAVDDEGVKLVLETTVHPEPAPPLPAEEIYRGKLNLTYDPIAWFDEEGFREDSEKAKKYEEIIYGP